MNYKIIMHSEVIKRDLQKIPANLLESIINSIEKRIAVRPYDFKPLSGKMFRGIYRLRVGNYRIAYCIEEDNQTVTIFCIDVRGKIYDKLQNRIKK